MSPVLILGLIILVGGCVSIERDESTNLLFIGNSYTFYNDIPMQIDRIGEELFPGKKIKTALITAGGASLRDHLTNPEALAKIAERGWDALILQGQSLEPLKSFEEFLTAAEELAALGRSAGAEVYFYETWARREGEPEYEHEWSGGNPAAMQTALHGAYAAAAERCGVRLIPVGSIWLDFHRAHPEIPLYRHDGSHPTPQGSSLAATVLAAYLFERDPGAVEYLPWGVSEEEQRLIRQFVSGALQKEGP